MKQYTLDGIQVWSETWNRLRYAFIGKWKCHKNMLPAMYPLQSFLTENMQTFTNSKHVHEQTVLNGNNIGRVVADELTTCMSISAAQYDHLTERMNWRLMAMSIGS